MSIHDEPGPYDHHQPRVTFNLEKAFRMESKTKQIPFVVAQELDNSLNPEGPGRQFLVFNDLHHFLYQRANYPNVHEIIRCPTYMENDQTYYKDDACKGRLIFDFDLVKPLSIMKVVNMKDPNTFIPHNFTWLIEDIIIETFTRYYKIDCSKLEFGWQYSPNPKKFSMHLVVRNAFFCEFWVQQLNIFYSLFKFVAAEMDLTYLMDAIDWQIARRNGSFRMIGSAKPRGEKLKLISYRCNGTELLQQVCASKVDIERQLVCIYNFKVLKEEQRISMSEIRYNRIKDVLDRGNNPELQQKVDKYLNIDHLRENPCKVEGEDGSHPREESANYDSIVNLFEAFNDGSYKMKSTKGPFISLQRLKASACPVSGEIHEHENPFLIATNNGLLVFRCRRGCKNHKGFEGCIIGTYNKALLESPKQQTFTSKKKGIVYQKEQITSKNKVEISVDEVRRNVESGGLVRVDQSMIQGLKNCKVLTAENAVILPDMSTAKNSSRLCTLATKIEIKIHPDLLKKRTVSSY